MSTTKRQAQRSHNRDLKGVSLLNAYAVEVLQRSPSTKIQCTSDDGKTLVEEDTDVTIHQQESIPPLISTLEEASGGASVESKTSTKVEKQACSTAKAWIKRRFGFLCRKKKGDDCKNAG